MTKISVPELKKGDFITNKNRAITGKILNVQHLQGYSCVRFLSKTGHESDIYFYTNEEVILEEEPENFEKDVTSLRKVAPLRQLYKPHCYLGTDPEMFVVDKNNEVIPSFSFLKSKADKDLTIEETGNVKGYRGHTTRQTIFWDGFQAEFNVYSATCLAWVIDSTFLGLKTLQQKAKAFDKNARLTIQSTLDVSPIVLQDAKKEHVEFGCMPSFNIYGMEGIKKDGRQVSYRSAGGHIHFGLANRDFQGKDKKLLERYIKTLDKILGVACVSLFANYDKAKRREMYGLAGEYRLPAHGIEYRTLSSAWMAHPLIMNMVFELARMSLSVVDKGLENLWDATEEETIKCINNCDVDLAREILARNKQAFINLQFSIYPDDATSTNLYKIYMLGMDSIIKNPDDVTNNWGLDGVFEGHCEGEGMKIGKIYSIPKYKELANEKVTEIYEELVKQINDGTDEVVETKTAKRA